MITKVLGRWLFVRQDPPSQIDSLIIIPEGLEEKPLSGVVEYCGENLSVGVGDRVVFSKFAYEEYEDLLIMRETDISLIFKNK